MTKKNFKGDSMTGKKADAIAVGDLKRKPGGLKFMNNNDDKNEKQV